MISSRGGRPSKVYTLTGGIGVQQKMVEIGNVVRGFGRDKSRR